MFLITVIEMEKYRWNYGRKWRPKRMPESVIRLPSKIKDGKDEPDWDFMEEYIKQCRYSVGAIEE